MLQDDLVCCKNVRSYLERELWPAPRVGLVSFYCPSVYGSSLGGFQLINAGEGLIGALTYVFPPAAVRSLLTHGATLAHRMRSSPAGTRSIDTVLGQWARARRFPIYYHVPSLAQHTGTASTLWKGATSAGSRAASHFVGETCDAVELMAARRASMATALGQASAVPASWPVSNETTNCS